MGLDDSMWYGGSGAKNKIGKIHHGRRDGNSRCTEKRPRQGGGSAKIYFSVG